MNDKYNYKTIYTTVKEDIRKGVYPTGTLLPTELTLADKYSVSRPTVSKVYNQLQKEGYVNKKKGLGTLVLFKGDTKKTYTFGLLLPGAGESEIFSIINDQGQQPVMQTFDAILLKPVATVTLKKMLTGYFSPPWNECLTQIALMKLYAIKYNKKESPLFLSIGILYPYHRKVLSMSYVLIITAQVP